MEKMTIRFKKVRPNAAVPSYGTAYSAGADLCACLDGTVVIGAGDTMLVPTGLALEIPEDHAGFVFARSGLATNKALAPANKVGVIDSDYRGELIVALRNNGRCAQTIDPGERIAQLVVMPVLSCRFVEAEELSRTARGGGGFGSTGSL